MSADLENEVHRLNAIIENQAKALGHWRQKSDQDTGTIARLRGVLASVEQHLEEMRRDERWHPVGHCPVLDEVRAALGGEHMGAL